MKYWLGLWVLVGAVACDDGGGGDDMDGGDGATTGVDSGVSSVGGDGAMTSAGSAGSTGGSGSGDAGSGDDGSGSDDAGSGGGEPAGQCMVDADCGTGQCIELLPNGLTVCQMPVVEATECLDGGFPDQCCTTDDCDAGICVTNGNGPSCSGAGIEIYNGCQTDDCATHDDCADGQICIPGGALGFATATCFAVACDSDDDCTDGPGGQCALVPTTTCCGDYLPRCRYADSGPIPTDCPP